MRQLYRTVIVISFCWFLSACDNPLPQSKMDYQGTWRGERMVLAISRQGQVSYERKEANVSTSINLPIKEFTKSGFTVGFGFFSSDFSVEQPPKEIDGVWMMQVDGVKLKRDH